MNTKGKNAVLIGEEDWTAIQKTLYLNSIPEMAESIIAGGNTPLEECLPDWQIELRGWWKLLIMKEL